MRQPKNHDMPTAANSPDQLSCPLRHRYRGQHLHGATQRPGVVDCRYWTNAVWRLAVLAEAEQRARQRTAAECVFPARSRPRIAAGQQPASGSVSAAPSLPEVPGDAVTGVLLRHPELDALALHHEIKEEFSRVAKA
jgi:hypothetical protein